MNETKIIKLYKDNMSMRSIAIKMNTNHKMISKILHNNGIETKKPLNLRGKKKFECDKQRLYNNMLTHIRFDIDLKWLVKFDDFDKLKFLNNAITNRDGRYKEDTKWYMSYIENFYSNEQFNKLYDNWKTNKDKYLKPSIDHIIPKSQGGTNDINNLQFLTWFENRCKNDMSQNEWNTLKNNINEYLV